jgi:hypothetical protein
MPQYMLLLYSDDPGAEVQAERDAEMPLWIEFTESLREAGLLLSADRLHPVESATTVRVRNGQTEIVDGPFAATKEYLGGYFLLECADLDEALRHAARAPLAHYGSVEVRPVVEMGPQMAASGETAAGA